ncbi:MAG: DNA-processing protein DprA [Ignavibacteriales bacterium]|nr:DNA-processing protein DprA [Ignavibacteriales bacterium]
MAKPLLDIRDLLRLSAIPGIGSNRIRTLISAFGSPGAVLDTAPRELIKIEGIEKKLASNIAHQQIPDSFLDDQLSRLNKSDGHIVTLWDDEYPEHLRRIFDPPAILFVTGTIEKCDKYSIALVGTRRPSPYGISVTEQFTKALTELGVTIVSGLARGIDTIAHQTAVRQEGRTLAVIGSGLDKIYPPENKKLAGRIEQNGAIISEFFMGTKPDPGNFPRRNRIISGISLGTLVIETTENGGAMITATSALDQNRELFAVPGSILDKNSIGTNMLIRDGHAKLVQSVDDIVAELEIQLKPLLKTPTLKPAPQLSVFEQTLYEVLSSMPMHIDEIIEQGGFSPSDTLVHLLGLEFKGMVRQLAGKLFIRT